MKDRPTMRNNQSEELTAVVHFTSPYPVFANRVDTKQIVEQKTHQFIMLEVNSGPEYFGGLSNEKYEEFRKLASHCEAVIFGNTIYVQLNPFEILYTIDISTIIPDGEWEIRVVRIGDVLRQIGVFFAQPGFMKEFNTAHVLNNEDLSQGQENICENKTNHNFVFDGDEKCHRPAGHLGVHQYITATEIFEWSSGGGSRSPKLKYGFPVYCHECGYVNARDKDEEYVCSRCRYWLNEAKQGGGFVIRGNHYRPGKGGYGGQEFSIQRFDGTTWSGELSGQGDVPSWMVDRLPDNAEFTSEQWF